MRIGYFTQELPVLPTSSGFTLYCASILKELSRDHTVDLVSIARPNEVNHTDWAKKHSEHLELIVDSPAPLPSRLITTGLSLVLGTTIKHRSLTRRLLKNLAASRGWDVLHVEGNYIAGLVPKDLGIPMILSVHDSPTYRIDEMIRMADSPKTRIYYRVLHYFEPRFERNQFLKFGAVTTVAERDSELIGKLLPSALVETVPCGTDSEYFHAMQVEKSPHDFVFHGNLSYPPNVAASVELATEILPRVRSRIPDARLRLVGGNPSPDVSALSKMEGVAIFPNLPDLRQVCCEAAVYACGIRYGTGMKNKILEAMALELPVVAYSEGIRGILAEEGVHYVAASSREEFASQVVSLLKDPQSAESLVRASRKLVETQYSWRARADQYVRLYKNLRARKNHGKQRLGEP